MAGIARGSGHTGQRPRGARQEVPLVARRATGPVVYVDDSDVQQLFRALGKVNADLRKDTNAQLRVAAKECGGTYLTRTSTSLNIGGNDPHSQFQKGPPTGAPRPTKN